MYFCRVLDCTALAVLHSRRLSVYTLSSTAGAVAHGVQYKLQPVYSHSLQRAAFNMCCGPFGEVQSRFTVIVTIQLIYHIRCHRIEVSVTFFKTHENVALGEVKNSSRLFPVTCRSLSLLLQALFSYSSLSLCLLLLSSRISLSTNTRTEW